MSRMVETRRGRFALSGAALACLVAGALPAVAASYHDIYQFKGGTDGSGPESSLVADSQGRLYGTTQYGGAYGYGTVFQLTPPAVPAGAWTEAVLHSFSGGDGYGPISPVTLGSDGSIYGTTEYGGGTRAGHGVVFKLSNAPGWPETVLHRFGKGPQGGKVQFGVQFGLDGLLYGTTSDLFVNGTYAETGTVYSVSPLGDQVEFKILHSFGTGTDGIDPGGLTLVPPSYWTGFVGSTYGTVGLAGGGTIYAEQLLSSGSGRETLLYRFPNSGSGGPLDLPTNAPIVGTGALKNGFYGCADEGGGPSFEGGLYSLVPNGAGGFTFTDLYDFGSQPNDPARVGELQDYPLEQVNSAGQLIGVSYLGGAYGNGTFFEFDPPTTPGGGWTEKVDVSFNSNDPNGGANPMGAPLRIGTAFYGALSDQYTGGNGAIYELTP